MSTDHGPECGERSECDCVFCYCGDRHQPGGFLGTCRRCGRKQRRLEMAT